MTKSVPDPPLRTSLATHASDREEALVRLSMSLAAALETNAQVCDMAERPVGDLAWATRLSLEVCQALTDSLLSDARQSN